MTEVKASVAVEIYAPHICCDPPSPQRVVLRDSRAARQVRVLDRDVLHHAVVATLNFALDPHKLGRISACRKEEASLVLAIWPLWHLTEAVADALVQAPVFTLTGARAIRSHLAGDAVLGAGSMAHGAALVFRLQACLHL